MGQIVPFNPGASANANAGWSAEERARLLELAERFAAGGIRVQVIHGTTDDGDPWCVVKDEFEEVLIHVARIGDAFVVHHALDDALRQGGDLRAVLKERLAWETPPNVVIPFGRRAQGLLALLIAAGFMYDSSPHQASGDHAPGGHDHPDGPSPHLIASTGELHAAAVPDDHLTGGQRPAVAPPSPLPDAATTDWRHPDWRSFASDDDTIGRADHGGPELARAPAAPAWAAAISNIDVAAAGPALNAGPEIAPPPTPLVLVARPPTSPGSEAGSVVPVQVASLQPTTPQHPVTLAPPAATPPVVLVATLTGVDLDGDGHPDLPPPHHGAPAPGPDTDPSHLHGLDHAAILAVGHSLPLPEIV